VISGCDDHDDVIIMNQIIIAMDNAIKEGVQLIETTEHSDKVYGYKIGSLWILEKGVQVIKDLKKILKDSDSDKKLILDMQKWGTDIPSIVAKQISRVSEVGVDELIFCPIGAGRDSLKAFIDTCAYLDIKPICVVKMTQPNADSYVRSESARLIYHDAKDCGCDTFVIPATKDLSDISFMRDYVRYDNSELYATGFKVQGGQIKHMVYFGVTKFIVGRAIYESDRPLKIIDEIFEEINI
jgi:orotidine-5'-phosphate decarboxylase